ncbi:type I restriction-modification system subunit M N-terminal domain-containing protein [Arthrobacter sp. D2-10]
MINGTVRAQVDKVRDTLWTGGISNPLEVIEQIKYLLFLKRLDEAQTALGRQANRMGGEQITNSIFPDGTDHRGRSQSDRRWSKFKDFSRDEEFTLFSEHMFPILRDELTKDSSGDNSTLFASLQHRASKGEL